MDATSRESSCTPQQIASGPTHTEVSSRGVPDASANDFPDAILFALLKAHATWIAARDPAALRRELVALLAQLG